MDRSTVDAEAAWIARHSGSTPRRRQPVGGGCIHQAWCIELEDGRRLFAKANSAAALPLLTAEADGLAALASAAKASGGSLVVPEPLAVGVVANQALLLLPWLELSAEATPSRWHAFGAALAALHRSSLAGPLNASDRVDGRFGWGQDNVIGSSPQFNDWQQDWGVFFAECRLAPQLRQLQRSGEGIAAARTLLDLVPSWLAGHHAEPCLVHGDLWSGNAALVAGAAGALFDPAVHRADREVDLAMARLFGGFPSSFFSGYEEAWPLPAGHQRRVGLYNLYHLLNHANLFGGGYRSRCQGLIAALLADPPL